MPSRAPADERIRPLRSLRVRLTLTYLVFLAVLLTVVGVIFRQRLHAILEEQAKAVLEEEWAAMRGYLRIEQGRPTWVYDRQDPDEAFIVERLRQVYLLTDAEGRVIQVSSAYQILGLETADEIRAAVRQHQAGWHTSLGQDGVPYLIRSGIIHDSSRHEYYISIGRSLRDNLATVERFTWTYFLVLPLLIVAGLLLGWLMAGRALQPVDEIAQTARRVTTENLNQRIVRRGANDELDHLIDAFNEMTGRLDASFTRQRQFSMDVSHELRTPLTAIRGQLEVALIHADSVEQYREAILVALEQVERLSKTVRSLLLLAQAESGELTLQLAPADLAEIVRGIVDQYQVLADSAGIALETRLQDGCWLHADRTHLERLTSNLVANALKYTPSGGRVSVRVSCASELAELEVADTGVGIPPDVLPLIYRRFYRAPGAEPGPDRGLGLGLSFVAWIVQAHQGTIDVESRVNEGTRFSVRLPLAPLPRSSQQSAI